MKKVLSLLLAYIFLQTQTWALSGGPVFSSGSSVVLSVIGTYAGVLLPEEIDTEGALGTGTPATATSDQDSTSTSIGLFSLGVPEAGPATGAMIVFVEGTAFNGNITGVVDPGTGVFRAIIDATSTYSIITLVPSGIDASGNVTFNTVDTFVFAQGSMEADIISLGGGGGGFPAPPGSTRLEGFASIDIFSALEADNTPDVTTTARYSVEGFKQSETVNQATLEFNPGFDPGGGGNGS